NESGDVRQIYDPSMASTSLRFKESQTPTVLGGLDHEWSPGNHTLFLLAHLKDDVRTTDPNASFLLFATRADGSIRTGTVLDSFSESYHSVLDAWSAELQQIAQAGPHLFIAGARLQETA